MAYKEVLSNMVKESGMTLREISSKCNEHGVKVAPSYISKLQNGTQAPASDEINIAIAKVLGGDPEELIFEGYIERAPELIKEFLYKFKGDMLGNAKHFALDQAPPFMKDIIEQQINDLTLYQTICMFLAQEGLFVEYENNSLVLKDNEYDDITVMMPSLKIVEMNDDGMAPLINKSDRIELYNNDDVKVGDIVLAVLEDKTFLIRRYCVQDNKVILVADNRDYKQQVFEQDEINIVCRVKSVTKEI